VPLYIKDDVTTQLVTEFARRRGLTKQAAVRLAVMAELEREAQAETLRTRAERLWDAHPMPPKTGEAADKEFFDALSGEE
jgi:antitoxin VapB